MQPWLFRAVLALLLVMIVLAFLSIVLRAILGGPVLKTPPAPPVRTASGVEPPPMRVVTTGWSYREERLPMEEVRRRLEAGEL